MIDNSTRQLFADYQMYLLKQKRMKKQYFIVNEATSTTSKENALALFKFFIEDLMKWKPNEANLYLNDDIIRLFGLTEPLKAIDKAHKYGSQKFVYVLSLLYPDIIKFDYEKYYIKIYENVLCNKEDFAKKFFGDINADYKLSVCLLYAINTFMDTKSIDELYEKFANKKCIDPFLRQYKLYRPCYERYSSPLECLHEALSITQKDDFLYNYYKFDMLYKSISESSKSQNQEEE